MKKGLVLTGLLFLLIGVLVTGCSAPKVETPAPTEAPAVTEAPAATEAATTDGLQDGKYYAASDAFDEKSGWKSYVLLEVSGGKVVAADWNAVSVKAGLNKKEASKAGFYPMVKNGGAKAEWHEQAALVEAFYLEAQDAKAITLGADGKTDAVSGVSITVDDFVVLADQALAAGPVAPGPYADGAYHAEEKEFAAQSGWKETVDLTVVNGYIVSVNWNGVHKNGGDDKKAASVSGAYGMVAKGAASAEWHVQALEAEKYLIEIQDPTKITYTDDAGHTDAISGVSVTVKGLFELAAEALK